ncbi:MAG: F0F1 ATP synthase subunit A [Proteobacteria bacterium]|nr:F0F1 ATP synthase subunit A [Pseudomonadota bacterium]
MHQFEVAPLFPLMVGGWDLSITNQALWTGIAVAMVIALFSAGVARMRLVPGRLQSFVELTVGFIQDLSGGIVGPKGVAFFPLILTVFLFVSCLNLVGMLPHAFTATSQITTTGYMAVLVFAMVLVVGFATQGLHFLAMFYPHGTPWWLAPLIVPLELISFLARPFTLAIRLTANMVAGHVLLKVFASFCIMLMGWFTVSLAAPFVMLLAITALELFVALLQAYIFTVLTCVYLNDALNGH